MSWIVIAAEGLVIAAIIVWLVIKRKALGKDDDEQDIRQDAPGTPDLKLPDDEKWE